MAATGSVNVYVRGVGTATLADNLAPGTIDGQATVLKGRSSENDGGEGLAVWDASDSSTVADNAIVWGSGTGRWKRPVDGMYSLKWFGAVGDGTTWDTTAWSEALEYCSKKSAALWVPPGKYRIASGYTQSTAYRDISIVGAGRMHEPASPTSTSSEILLDSASSTAFVLRCTARGTLNVRGVMFRGTGVADQPAFLLESVNPHSFIDVGFVSVGRPVVYAIGSYHQSSAFRDVIFHSSGTIHSEIVDAGVASPDSLCCTVLRLDNVNHESTTPANTEKVLMNLTGCREIVADNLLLEGTLPSAGWTVLRLHDPYDAPYTRAPYATLRNTHIEFSAAAYEPEYVIDQIGGSVEYDQLLCGLTATSQFKLSSSARAIISRFAADITDPSTLFDIEDDECSVEFVNCSMRWPPRNETAFTHRSTVAADSLHLQTTVSNDAAQCVARWRGGLLAAENIEAVPYSGGVLTQSTDATYGRKLLLAPTAGNYAASFRVYSKGVVGAGDQVIMSIHCKLPTFSAGDLAFSTSVDATFYNSSTYSTAYSGSTISIMLPCRIPSACTHFGITCLSNGATLTGSGVLEIYSMAFYHGERVPRRELPNYDVNIVTSATAAPTTGTWAAGDIVKNSAPAVGNPKGWVCTVAGSPGTWASEGNL